MMPVQTGGSMEITRISGQDMTVSTPSTREEPVNRDTKEVSERPEAKTETTGTRIDSYA